MNELIQLTAAEAAAKLAAGEITSVELTQAHLDRHRRHRWRTPER